MERKSKESKFTFKDSVQWKNYKGMETDVLNLIFLFTMAWLIYSQKTNTHSKRMRGNIEGLALQHHGMPE